MQRLIHEGEAQAMTRFTRRSRPLAAIAVALTTAAVGAGVARAHEKRCDGEKTGSCPPTIGDVTLSAKSETTATVSATINPDGSATTYSIWLEWAPCQNGAGECGEPSSEKRQVAHGQLAKTDGEEAIVETLRHLSHGCSYRYWFVASGDGTSESRHKPFKTRGEPGLGCRG